MPKCVLAAERRKKVHKLSCLYRHARLPVENQPIFNHLDTKVHHGYLIGDPEGSAEPQKPWWRLW